MESKKDQTITLSDAVYVINELQGWAYSPQPGETMEELFERTKRAGELFGAVKEVFLLAAEIGTIEKEGIEAAYQLIKRRKVASDMHKRLSGLMATWPLEPVTECGHEEK